MVTAFPCVGPEGPMGGAISSAVGAAFRSRPPTEHLQRGRPSTVLRARMLSAFTQTPVADCRDPFYPGGKPGFAFLPGQIENPLEHANAGAMCAA